MKKKSLLCYLLVALMCVSTLPFLPEVSNAATAATEDLVLHLKFDGDLKDSSNNSLDANCTFGTITYEEGILGKSAVFNGKSYAEIPDADALDLKDKFTISLWLYKEEMGEDYVPFVYKELDEVTGEIPYSLYEHSSDIPGIYLHDGGAGTDLNQYYVDGDVVDIRKWFLYTVTYDGKEIRLYNNKRLMKKVSISGELAASTGDLYIGMMNDLYGAIYFDGKMDDLRIYNNALSADEVGYLYDEGFASNPDLLQIPDRMVAYFKFENNFKDSSDLGNDAEKVTGEGSIKYVDAIAGKGARFSKGSYLEVEDNDSINFDDGFSMSAWVCILKNDVDMPLLNRPGASTSLASNDMAYMVAASNDTWRFEFAPSTDYHTIEGCQTSFESSLANKWVHIALTFDGEEIRWYKNGTVVEKEDVDEMVITHASGELMIGSDGKDFLEGILDELKLYNYALSADEVKKDVDWKDSLFISKDNQSKIKALKVKDTVALAPSRTYIDTGATVALTLGVTYKSSNTKIFIVSKEGKITAVKKGTATLSITHGGISKTYKVTVK